MVHIDAKMETATFLINTGIMAVFHSTKCQRWEYKQKNEICKAGRRRIEGNNSEIFVKQP